MINKYIAIIFCIILLAISISIFIILNNKTKFINDNVNKFNQTLDNINTQLKEKFSLAAGNCVSESGINELNNLYLSLKTLNVLKMDVENVFPSSNITFDIPRKEVLSNIDKLVNKIKAWQKAPLCKNLCTDVGQVYNPNQNTCMCYFKIDGRIHDTISNECKMVTELWNDAEATGNNWNFHDGECTNNKKNPNSSYYMKNGNALFFCNRNKATPTIDWIIQRNDVIKEYEKSGLPMNFNSGWH